MSATASRLSALVLVLWASGSGLWFTWACAQASGIWACGCQFLAVLVLGSGPLILCSRFWDLGSRFRALDSGLWAWGFRNLSPGLGVVGSGFVAPFASLVVESIELHIKLRLGLRLVLHVRLWLAILDCLCVCVCSVKFSMFGVAVVLLLLCCIGLLVSFVFCCLMCAAGFAVRLFVCSLVQKIFCCRSFVFHLV